MEDEEIELTKYDVAVDLKGAFLPKAQETTFKFLQEKLVGAINEVFGTSATNFLSRGRF